MEPYFLLSLSTIGALILIGISLVIGALKGLKKDMAAIGDQQGVHEVKLTRIEVVLTGADGTNGINGEVKSLRRRVDEWDRRVGESDRRHSA